MSTYLIPFLLLPAGNGPAPIPEPTTVCVVNEGIPGEPGTPDGLDRLDCSTRPCVIIDGLPGRDGAPATARLVVCYGTEQ